MQPNCNVVAASNCKCTPFVYSGVRVWRFLFTSRKQALTRQRHLSILCCGLFSLPPPPPSFLVLSALLCLPLYLASLPTKSLTQYEKLDAFAHFARSSLFGFAVQFIQFSLTREFARADLHYTRFCVVRFGSAPANRVFKQRFTRIACTVRKSAFNYRFNYRLWTRRDALLINRLVR